MLSLLSRIISRKRIYLDYAAATPLNPKVEKAMSLYWGHRFANPGAIHREGQYAKAAVENARASIAKLIQVTPEDIIFTGSGTESNNLALRGRVEKLLADGVSLEDIEIITTPVEHPSILETVKRLERAGYSIKYASVDEAGLVAVEEFKALLTPKTRLVTIAIANSETGVIQDIGKLSRLTKAYAREHQTEILFHTDAAQAPLWLPYDPERLGVDMVSLDAGKCEGPKGIGVLIKRPRAELLPILDGGSQEDGLRPGTEAVPQIVGAAAALELADKNREARVTKVGRLRDAWLGQLEKLPGVVLNGSRKQRLANNVNISIEGLDSEYLVVALDAAGIAASTRSACSGVGGGYSHVVYEMTGDKKRASSTVRFTLTPETTMTELKRVTKAIKQHQKLMGAFPTN